MKKVTENILLIIIILFPLGANSQSLKEIVSTSDSIISVFNTQLEKTPYEKIELVSFGDDFYIDYQEKDTFLLENMKDFKFVKIKETKDHSIYEYYQGTISDIKRIEKTIYYFDKHNLLMTDYIYIIKGDEYEDMGYNYSLEEKRFVFDHDQNLWGYITRDGEGNSLQNNVNFPFSAINVHTIIYDKNQYETIGKRLNNGEIDFLYE